MSVEQPLTPQSTPSEYKIGVYWRRGGFQFNSASSIIPVILTVTKDRIQLKTDHETLLDCPPSEASFKFIRIISTVQLRITHAGQTYKIHFVPSPTSPSFSDSQIAELHSSQELDQLAKTTAALGVASAAVDGAVGLLADVAVVNQTQKLTETNNRQAALLLQALRNHSIPVPNIYMGTAPLGFMLSRIMIAVALFTIGFFPLIIWVTNTFPSNPTAITNWIAGYILVGIIIIIWYPIHALSAYKGKS